MRKPKEPTKQSFFLKKPVSTGPRVPKTGEDMRAQEDDQTYGDTSWQVEMDGVTRILTTVHGDMGDALSADQMYGEAGGSPRRETKNKGVQIYDAKQAARNGDFETAFVKMEALRRATMSPSVYQTAICLMQVCEIITGKARYRTIFLPKDAPTQIIIMEWIDLLIRSGKKMEAARVLTAYANSKKHCMERDRFAQKLGAELIQVETEQRLEDMAHVSMPTLPEIASFFICYTPKKRRESVQDHEVMEALVYWMQCGAILTRELFETAYDIAHTESEQERSELFSLLGGLFEAEDAKRVRHIRAQHKGVIKSE